MPKVMGVWLMSVAEGDVAPVRRGTTPRRPDGE
jgi:hypothetical protein